MSGKYLSRQMVDVLISHMDGPVHINRLADSKNGSANTVAALIDRRLIRPGHGPRPKRTWITDAGRMALAKALGDIADRLTSAEHDKIDPPLEETEHGHSAPVIQPLALEEPSPSHVFGYGRRGNVA